MEEPLQTERPQTLRHPQPERPHRPHQEEAVVALRLVERHQQQPALRRPHRAPPVVGDDGAALYRLEAGQIGADAKSVALADRVPVAHLHHHRQAAALFRQAAPRRRRFGAAVRQQAGGLEGDPDRRRRPLLGPALFVLTGFESERDDALGSQVMGECAAQLLFQTEDQRHREVEGEAPVQQRVVEDDKGRSGAGDGVEIEGIDLAPCFTADQLELPVQLGQLGIFCGGRRAGAYCMEARRQPHPVEVFLDVAAATGQGLEVTGQSDQLTARQAVVGQPSEDALQPAQPGRLVAVQTGNAKERRTRVATANPAEDARPGPLRSGGHPGARLQGSRLLASLDARACRHQHATATPDHASQPRRDSPS